MSHWALVLFLASVAIGCGNSRPPPRRASLAVVPRDRPVDLTCPHLPTAVAGFRLGSESSMGRAGTRCIHEAFDWTELPDGATCSGAPMRVLYPATVRLVSCGSHVCALQVRYQFGGETALRNGLQRIQAHLEEEYGSPPTWVPDSVMPCPRVEGDIFGCVLDGIGIVQMRWPVVDPELGPLACEQDPTAFIALRAEGDRGTHDGLVTVTYVTADAVALFERIHL